MKKHKQGPGREKIIITPDRVKFRHLYSKDKMPRMTVCYMKMGDMWAKGYALCSHCEGQVKNKEGRKHARNRAHMALGRQRDSEKVRREEAQRVLQSVINDLPIFFDFFKSQFKPELSSDEKQLLGLA